MAHRGSKLQAAAAGSSGARYAEVSAPGRPRSPAAKSTAWRLLRARANQCRRRPPTSALPALSVRFLTDMTDYAGNVWEAVPGLGWRWRSPADAFRGECGTRRVAVGVQPGWFPVRLPLSPRERWAAVVLRGAPVVHLPTTGDRQLREGDVFPCHAGLVAPIRSRNETDDVVRVLIVSTNADPDVAEYPNTEVQDYTQVAGLAVSPTGGRCRAR